MGFSRVRSAFTVISRLPTIENRIGIHKAKLLHSRHLRCCSTSSLSSPINNNHNKDAIKVENTLHDFPLDDPSCNIPASIASRVGAQLHRRPQHPLHILQQRIVRYWQTQGNPQFQHFDNLSPIVTTRNNFDVLRIPLDHVSRSPSDTYYCNASTVLRTHTSAHQVDLLQAGHTHFLVTGDVYRRDEIDTSHYPIFHQMEGVRLFSRTELQELTGSTHRSSSSSNSPSSDSVVYIQQDLKEGLQGLAQTLFGPTECRWVDTTFPFTHPSLELEIFFQDAWLEVLGCGVIHPDIIRNAGLDPQEWQGWAFGLGLERLAMVLFDIPDIRLFWTDDIRFHQQFAQLEYSNDSNDDFPKMKFQPYSKYPPCYKDISFWIPNDKSNDPIDESNPDTVFHVNDLNEIIRSVAGDWVEQVTLVDSFVHPRTQQHSHCYRITYRSMDRSLTNDEVDALQAKVREQTAQQLGVILR
jgi:phenylalanyl-tRNA synthetase alpha chain